MVEHITVVTKSKRKTRANKIDFLKSVGSDTVKHSGRTLLDHLIGTSEILKNLGAPKYLQDAGLFHSIYGTALFMPEGGLVDNTYNRQVIKDLIGEHAEEIAYQFCILNLPRLDQILKFNGQLKKDLILLNTANGIEQSPNNMMTDEYIHSMIERMMIESSPRGPILETTGPIPMNRQQRRAAKKLKRK
tara:strand:- start:364 stop:930 length:567 start_codon:yes stop_codon:yes gene_type:complete